MNITMPNCMDTCEERKRVEINNKRFKSAACYMHALCKIILYHQITNWCSFFRTVFSSKIEVCSNMTYAHPSIINVE